MNPFLKPVRFLAWLYCGLSLFFVGLSGVDLYRRDLWLGLWQGGQAVGYGGISFCAFLFYRHMNLVSDQFEQVGKLKLIQEMRDDLTQHTVSKLGIPE